MKRLPNKMCNKPFGKYELYIVKQEHSRLTKDMAGGRFPSCSFGEKAAWGGTSAFYRLTF